MTLCKNRLIALILRLVGLGIGIFGLAIMFLVSDANLMLSYYTIQSNLFVVALFLGLSIATIVQIARSGIKGQAAYAGCSFQLAITFYITITFIVYWTLLSWQNFEMSEMAISAELYTASNYVVHGIVPILAILDWILFVPHGNVRGKSAVAWLTYPILYAIFIFIRAEVGAPFTNNSRYPYPFIDVDELGGWVVLVIIGLAVAFYALGRLFIFIDDRLAKAIRPSYYALQHTPYERCEGVTPSRSQAE